MLLMFTALNEQLIKNFLMWQQCKLYMFQGKYSIP